MNDRSFFKTSIKIFESYFFKRQPENMELFDDTFWQFATEKIHQAISENPRLIYFMKLIYQHDEITEGDLLNLLFSTTCKRQALFNKIVRTPDEWGKQLIWPFYAASLVKLADWASPNTIDSMMKVLNIQHLAKIFNETARDTTYLEFPKTYKSLGSYF